MKHFQRKVITLSKFGACKGVYFQLKLRSGVAIQIYPEQILTTADTHSRTCHSLYFDFLFTILSSVFHFMKKPVIWFGLQN